MANVYRVESPNRIIIVANQSNGEYRISTGSKLGKLKTEMRKILSVPAGRTADQEVDVHLAKILNARVKHGFELKKGDLNELNARVEMITKGVSQKARLEKQLKRMEPLFKKAEVVFKKRQEKLNAIRTELAKFAPKEEVKEEVKA